MKAQYFKRMKSRARKERMVPPPRVSSARGLQERLAERTRELAESRKQLGRSLEQQTAMAQVLGIISSSPSDLRPVFDAILAHATHLCEGNFALLCRNHQGVFVGEATCNGTPEFTARFMGLKFQPGREGPTRLATLERRTVHIADMTVEPGFSPLVLQHEQARTVLAVPLLHNATLTGAITIWRREVRPFTEQQIELVTTIAAQAVIAIENARLLRELNREREALARQHQTDARYISWLRQLAGFLRHEVRQPVAQINSSVELIHLTSHDDQLKPYIASAAQGVRDVWNLIERASRATDAEAFVRQGQAQPIDLARLLRELMGSYLQTHSGINFRLQLPDKQPLYVSADPSVLKEAVSNLMANAASFADEESIIQVVLERDGVNAVIKVRNKGPIIQYDTEMLFGPFASTRSGPSSEHQGLGLYLVRLVAEHHGGKALISNLDDKSGVEAAIVLPL
jgi:signal transduction histidine kinase